MAGRYYSGKKQITAACHSVSVKLFKDYGCFKRYEHHETGTISFSIGDTITGQYAFIVNLGASYVRLKYEDIDDSGKPIQKDYLTELTTTACNFGGVRYWFRCNGCKERVGILYKDTYNIFKCRKCLNLTYKSRNLTRSFRPFQYFFDYEMLYEKRYKLKRLYYRDSLTHKHKSLMKRIAKCEANMASPEQLRQFFDFFINPVSIHSL